MPRDPRKLDKNVAGDGLATGHTVDNRHNYIV